MTPRPPITNAALADRPGLGAGASVGLALPHDSAARHVQGTAAYIDDLPEPAGTVHVAPGYATGAGPGSVSSSASGTAAPARGAIRSLDLDAVRASPGVLAVLTAADVPATNDCSPAASGDDPILADGEIHFHGQVVFAVVAGTRDAARRAARRARIEIDARPPAVTVDQGLAAGAEMLPPYEFRRGEPAPAIAAAPHRLEGRVRIGGQDHFYLEGQAALALPGEDDEMRVFSSTQHPSEVQNLVAHMLGVPSAAVVCECRRMGGAFGGKESQAAQWACLAALAAHVTGRPAKLRLDRDDDMTMTGKRHDFRVDWRCGFDGEGVLEGVDVELNARCGCSADLSLGVNDRAMFHADNAYHYPAARIHSRPGEVDRAKKTHRHDRPGSRDMTGHGPDFRTPSPHDFDAAAPGGQEPPAAGGSVPNVGRAARRWALARRFTQASYQSLNAGTGTALPGSAQPGMASITHGFTGMLKFGNEWNRPTTDRIPGHRQPLAPHAVCNLTRRQLQSPRGSRPRSRKAITMRYPAP